MRIREIMEKDNKGVEDVIRYCLREYGADHEGTAWTDPELSRFYQLYVSMGDNAAYWVIEDEEEGKIVGGVGIGPLPGVTGVCELQKMYTYPEIRGRGLAQELMDIALSFAKDKYKKCYLETFSNMDRAKRFYERNGFVRIKEPLGNTGHFNCDVRYLKDL